MRRFSSHGFTLVEILVVTVIVGVLATVAALSIGSRALDDRLETEARRLRELMSLALDEAVLQGRELGFMRTAAGYAFLTLQDGDWQVVDSGPLRGRALEPPFELVLEVEGRVVAPPAAADDADDELKPQVLLLSSGEATAFRLDLRAADFAPHYVLEGDALGRLKLERKEGP